MAVKGNYRIVKNKLRNSNITKNRVRIALVLVLATSIIGLAPGFSTSARAVTYSVFSVQGNYVDHSESWYFGSGSVNFLPGSLVGLITFTPATGSFHSNAIGTVAGETRSIVVDGTYTVDANGHGTMTWFSPVGDPRHRDFYIVNGGAELKYIGTDPPGSPVARAKGTMTKQ
jgi:hypothetical protein